MVILAALPGMVRELLVTGNLVKPGNFSVSVNFLGYRIRKVGLAMSFLIAHQVYPNFFNLSGPLAPISIRDQMVRAQAIVEDAIAEGLIGPPDRPLLVVGAGAAGAAAAIWAADHRVPTTLIDRGPSAFTLQAACTTRRIDPSQYDWPVDHWVTPDFPCVPFPTAMRWSETFSHLLAAGWQAQLKAA